MMTIALILCLMSCEQNYAPDIKQEHNRTGVPIIITTTEYPRYSDVSNSLDDFNKSFGKPLNRDLEYGWSAWDKEAPYECVIHYKKPAKIDDADIMTLGHEMAHCLYGSYH